MELYYEGEYAYRTSHTVMDLRIPDPENVVDWAFGYPSHESDTHVIIDGERQVRTRAYVLGSVVDMAMGLNLEPDNEPYGSDMPCLVRLADPDFAYKLFDILRGNGNIHVLSLHEVATIFGLACIRTNRNIDLQTLMTTEPAEERVCPGWSFERRQFANLSIILSKGGEAKCGMPELLVALLCRREANPTDTLREVQRLASKGVISYAVSAFLHLHSRTCTLGDLEGSLTKLCWTDHCFIRDRYSLDLQQFCDALSSSGALFEGGTWYDFEDLVNFRNTVEPVVVPITVLLHHHPLLVTQNRYGNWSYGMQLGLLAEIASAPPKHSDTLRWCDWSGCNNTHAHKCGSNGSGSLRTLFELALKMSPTLSTVDVYSENIAIAMGVGLRKLRRTWAKWYSAKVDNIITTLQKRIRERLWADGSHLSIKLMKGCKRSADEMAASY